MKSENKKEYHSELRDRQKEMTRDLILEAVCDFILEGKILSFSVQDVADRAGISYGTVYKHFPNREMMLESLYNWGFSSKRPKETYPTNLDELLSQKASYRKANKREMDIFIAINRVLPALNILPENMVKRDTNSRKIIEEEFASLGADFIKNASAILVMMNSFQSHTTLMTRFGLTRQEAAAAADWMTEVVVEELKRKKQ